MRDEPPAELVRRRKPFRCAGYDRCAYEDCARCHPERESGPDGRLIEDDDEQPLVVAFGGGVNSTAMLCGFRERGIRPSLILFADTGGEHPHTYAHVAEMDTLCRLWWGHGIETVRKLYQGEFEGLEKECLRGKKLPALAYGSRACSVKYKHEPQNRRMKQWAEGRRCLRAIGFDAGEPHRVKESTDAWADNWYPLVEWGWRRADCMAAIKRAGLTPPPKSSCFFCPAMKRWEILNLPADLKARALAVEDHAVTRNGIGLGGQGRYWRDMINADERQAKLFDWIDQHDASAVPCGCFDGAPEHPTEEQDER